MVLGRPAGAVRRGEVSSPGPAEQARRRASEPSPQPGRGRHELRRLLREWLTEVKVMGRSPQTVNWYQKKFDWYLGQEGGPATLEGLTSREVMRLLAALQDRGLAPNTVHGFFQVIRGFANWGYERAQALSPLFVGRRN